MRVVPVRPAWLQVVAVFGGFLIGPFVGLLLGKALTPDSGLAQTAAAFGFVLVFVGGTLIWAGLGFVTFAVGTLRRLVSGRAPRSTPTGEEAQRLAPPGYGAYVVLGTLVGIGVGLLAGVTADVGLGTATAIWTGVGFGYGGSLWAAAHHGYLPFLEPE